MPNAVAELWPAAVSADNHCESAFEAFVEAVFAVDDTDAAAVCMSDAVFPVADVPKTPFQKSFHVFDRSVPIAVSDPQLPLKNEAVSDQSAVMSL